MKDVLYAVKNIRADELNKITDELDADMQIVWRFITDTIIRGTGHETTIYNLCQLICWQFAGPRKDSPGESWIYLRRRIW